MTDESLTRSAWATLLEELDTPTFGELVGALEHRDDDMVPGDPEALVERAVADGTLVEDDATGAFPEYRLADEGGGNGPARDDDTPACTAVSDTNHATHRAVSARTPRATADRAGHVPRRWSDAPG